MFPEDLTASWETLLVVVVGTVGIYLALVMFSRAAGLRSFAQMTNFDMAATIAFGSIVATTAASTSTSLLQGVVALAVLFAAQSLIARLRRRKPVANAVDGGPLLLMSGTQVLRDNLARAQMTRNDLRSKLRLAGVTRFEQVCAVVLEATGEVSVLTAEPGDPPLDLDLMLSVEGREQLTSGDGAWNTDALDQGRPGESSTEGF